MNPEPIVYSDYKIFHFGDGFNQVALLGRDTFQFTSFVATKDDTLGYGFLFAVSTREAALHSTQLTSADLTEQALECVKQHLDNGQLADREEYRFEYHFDGSVEGFRPVTNPLWASENPR